MNPPHGPANVFRAVYIADKLAGSKSSLLTIDRAGVGEITLTSFLQQYFAWKK